jgi:integrase
MKFSVERVVPPKTGAPAAWVVVDEFYQLHREACTYLESLRGRGCSVNTERVYACRVALYLSWCGERGLDWAAPGFENLLRFRDWLVSEPLPPRGKRPPGRPRFRRDGSADAVLCTMTEFLRFGGAMGWVGGQVVSTLSQPKHLRFVPSAWSLGEVRRLRHVEARTLRFRTDDPGIECFTPEQVAVMVELAGNARDRFLIVLMRVTGLRIGEALGLRREDLHFLPDSTTLGCRHCGPHVHVRRRADNVNGALAKSRVSRVVPVNGETIDFYRDYRWERDQVPEAEGCGMVFVNLYRAPLGAAMKCANTKQKFDRIAKRAQITARPHMLRHTAATEWIAEDVPHDVVSDLLGHASAVSLRPYLHPSDARKREAVERVAAVAR